MADAIPASPLLAAHLRLLNAEMTRQMEAAVRSEAETRGIDLDGHAFDAGRLAFVPRP